MPALTARVTACEHCFGGVMTYAIAIVILLCLFAVWMVSTYNRLIQSIEAVNNNYKQIDIQLDRRYKVFESLIEVVKKYMNYEQSTLKDVVALRNQSQQAQLQGNTSGQIEAENKISKIVSGLNVVFEQYPDLKANQNALQLQEEIVNTENKLAFAKQAYNDSVEKYNVMQKSFFEAMVVAWFSSKLYKNFVYWNLPDDQIKDKENYSVKLS